MLCFLWKNTKIFQIVLKPTQRLFIIGLKKYKMIVIDSFNGLTDINKYEMIKKYISHGLSGIFRKNTCKKTRRMFVCTDISAWYPINLV